MNETQMRLLQKMTNSTFPEGENVLLTIDEDITEQKAQMIRTAAQKAADRLRGTAPDLA